MPAAEVATSAAPTELTPDALKERIAQVEGATDLPDTVQVELIDLYRKTLDLLTQLATSDAQIAEFEQGRQEAPELIQSARARIAALPPTSQPTLDVEPGATLDQLNVGLGEAEAEQRAQQQAASKLEESARKRSDRRALIPELLADANKRLEAAESALAVPPAAEASPQLVAARRQVATARKQAVEREIRALQEELRYYEARSELLAARREEAQIQAQAATARVEAWRALVTRRRAADIEAQKRQADADLSDAPQPVQALARDNREYVEERSTLSESLQKAIAVRGRLEATIAELAQDQKTLEKNIEAVGLDPHMLHVRSTLENLRVNERNLRQHRQESRVVQARISELEGQRASLINLDARVTKFLDELALDEEGRGRLEPRVRALLETQAQAIGQLVTEYESYSNDLAELVATEQRLIAKIDEFARYIDQRALWVRSAEPLQKLEWPENPALMVANLKEVGAALWRDVLRRPALYIATGLMIALLFVIQFRVLAHGRLLAQRVAKPQSDSIGYSLVALLYAVLLALPWTLLLGVVGVRLPRVVDSAAPALYDLARALGGGMQAAALAYFTFRFLRHLCRSKGLAEAHFRWDARAIQRLRRTLIWFLPVLVPCSLVIVTTESLADSVWRNSVGRLAFLLLMLATLAAVFRIFSPASGIFASRLERYSTGWLNTLRGFWFTLVLAIPAALIVASVLGYHYAAVQFSERLLFTLWLVIAIVLIQALLTRSVLIAQRRIAIEQARKKREAAAKSDAPEEAVLDDREINVLTIGEQNRRLLRASSTVTLVLGLWFTWSALFPALSFLNDVTLWKYTSTVVAEDGAATPTVEEITLANLAAALIIAAAASALARNIPGLLEITILQRLPLDAGGRYAFTAVTRYVITVVGVMVTFGAMGIGWSKLQWLVAAVSLGLGFGLQEIFANFISGLIMLFERPVRIGDVVTVGDVTGMVSRIRIRATTITDWDRKELIIPNREFVTGQVINWTLSDRTLRMVVPVGVAYGSDTALVERELLRVAREMDTILDDPSPMVVFSGFGASTLDFDVRFFVLIDNFLSTRHRMHLAIDRAFRDAGIEIAFPQQDVHVRSIQAVLPVQGSQGREVPASVIDGGPGGT